MGKIREIRKDPHRIGGVLDSGQLVSDPLSLLANLANEPAAGAAREWATLKRDMAAKMRGPRYGGLTRRQVETLIRRYQAGHIDVGTFLFVYAWRRHLDRETTPSPLLLRAGYTYFAQVIGEGRVDLAKELVKALTFLVDRKVGDIGKVDFGYSHWWKLCVLHYMLNHPKDQYRTGELHAYVRAPGTRKLTSREVLNCELEIVLAAHDGRRRHAALNPAYEPSPALSAEQTTAVRRILSSRDFITLFRGGAGTGKSFTLKEVERGLTVANRPVVILAPQRQQVRDLQADGLPADTVAHALAVRTLPAGAVVIVDEAGQLGGRELRDVIRMTKAHGGRLLLSGDTRQHGAVAASDALRAIEEHAGLKPAHIRSIRRQDPKLGTTLKERAFIRAYRAAVKAAASGEVLDSFERLDRLGCVQELAPDERRSTLAAHYLGLR